MARELRIVLVLLALLGDVSPVEAQYLAPPRKTPWSVGPTFAWGSDFPGVLSDSPCDARGGYLVGAVADWRALERHRWLALQADLGLVSSISASCEPPPRPPEGEGIVIDTDLTDPFVALNLRAAVELPFEPGGLRVHAGLGVLVGGFRPAWNRGVAWFARSGGVTVTVGLDWWTTWAGGVQIRETWDEAGTTREEIGPFEESQALRFFTLVIGWDVGPPFPRSEGGGPPSSSALREGG